MRRFERMDVRDLDPLASIADEDSKEFGREHKE